MPIHFNDVDLDAEVSGLKTALIVPCIMCPAVTVSIREKQPLMKLFRSIFKSAPFEEYLKALQTRLCDKGIKADIFKSRLYQHWFLCMWSSARRKKLQRHAQGYEAVIVLGCDSALETIRDSLKSTDCKIVEGMRSAGLTNAKLKIEFPGNVCFEGVKIIPMPQQK
jgi:hypothetical protein